MGEDIDRDAFTRDDHQRYRGKLRDCFEVLQRLLDADAFERDRQLAGLEMEFYVTDPDGHAAHVNAQLLERIASRDFQTELAQFNIEFNLAPHKLSGAIFREMEEELDTSFWHAERRAAALDAHVAMIGILPTLRETDVTLGAISANPRYRLLNDQILEARGEDLVVAIDGAETLRLETASIMVEAAATSTQLHLQVSPEAFAATWNAAQAVAGAQVAVAANSPFFLGKQLWQETRIALFEQSIDTRTEELTAQGVRPRVWFGEGWIDGAAELFEENLRYFPALLPELDDENPADAWDNGEIPHLRELTLHNGTVYRWNRPVYAVARGKPHLRVENRVLPAGPTLVDTIANAAFWYGLVRGLADSAPPITEHLSFAAAQRNFVEAARHGIDATLHWPGQGEVPASELIASTLLPLAAAGLDAWSVDPKDRDHYLGIIEQRCRTGLNGASWQVAAVRAAHDRGLDRRDALLHMTQRYLDHMRANEPVHTWPTS